MMVYTLPCSLTQGSHDNVHITVFTYSGKSRWCTHCRVHLLREVMMVYTLPCSLTQGSRRRWRRRPPRHRYRSR